MAYSNQINAAHRIDEECAGPIVDLASMAAYCLPSLDSVRARVARATDGAAPKSPANPLGRTTSAITANTEAIKPPKKNRYTHSTGRSLKPPVGHNARALSSPLLPVVTSGCPQRLHICKFVQLVLPKSAADRGLFPDADAWRSR